MMKMWQNCLLIAFLSTSVPTFAVADQLEEWHLQLANSIKDGTRTALEDSYKEGAAIGKGKEFLLRKWAEIEPYLKRMKDSAYFPAQYTASITLKEVAASFYLLRDKAKEYLK